MKIIMVFDLPNETVKDILDRDLHAEDAIAVMNEEAMYGEQIRVWHFEDDKYDDVASAISNFWK